MKLAATLALIFVAGCAAKNEKRVYWPKGTSGVLAEDCLLDRQGKHPEKHCKVTLTPNSVVVK